MSFYDVHRHADPVTRQLVMRTAVINHLTKDMKRQWQNWQSCKQLQAAEGSTVQEQQLVSLQQKASTAYALLTREYADLSGYVIGHLNVWNSPEFQTATDALDVASTVLKSHLVMED